MKYNNWAIVNLSSYFSMAFMLEAAILCSVDWIRLSFELNSSAVFLISLESLNYCIIAITINVLYDSNTNIS